MTRRSGQNVRVSSNSPRRQSHAISGRAALAVLGGTFSLVGILVALTMGGTFDSWGTSTPSLGVNVTSSTLYTFYSSVERAQCNADAAAVGSALSIYDASSSHSVESGIVLGEPSTYAQGEIATALLRGQYVSSWPTNVNGYAISVSTLVPGEVSVYVPANNPAPVTFSREGSSGGCNAN